ncbi:hypothetical protein Tco_1303247 [Tanacetum coccineum]
MAPSHTKKIFGNMRRVWKGFSARETPLFPTIMSQVQEEMGEGSEIPTDPHHTPTIIQPSASQPQKKQKPRRTTKKVTQVPQSSVPSDNVADEAVNEEMDDSLARAATCATSLDAEHDRGNINKTQSKVTLNEPSSIRTSSGSGPRCQETVGDTIAQTRSENISTPPNDPLLTRGNTLQSGKGSMQLNELMELCTNLQTRVLDLEKTKTTQAKEIASLKNRVKKLEHKKRSRTHGLKRLYKVGLTARVESSEDEDIFGVNDQDDVDMFDVNTLTGAEVIVDNEDVVKTAEETGSVVEKAKLVSAVEETVNAATTTTTTTIISDDKITLAKAHAELKSAKPPTQGITTATTTITADSTRPKTKGIVMQEPKPEKPLKKKDQIKFDEEEAQRLEDEFDEQERIEREKAEKEAEANIALKETWDDIQAKIKVDCLLAKRLQAREQEELTIVERAKLFQQLLEKRRKHFAANRAEEKRNRPPTRAQQRSIMCTYLKNMEGWKPKSLKNKSFGNIQELFDKEMKRVNTFVDYRTELVEESSKKAKTEQEESSKRA